jgi:1-acyl-sn-glycerol-3-phosphate acyltransferase
MIYWLSRKTFEILIHILFRFEALGTENVPGAPCLIASNHASLLDPPLVGIACKKHFIDFMAKKELFDRPFFGRWCRMVGCIEVKRGDNAVKSLKEAARRLSQGRVVAIFPEGTRSVTGEMQNAKRGTGFLIAKANVPVLPVFVDGSGKAIPKGGKWNIGARVRVYIGKPVMPYEFSALRAGVDRDYEAITSLVMDRISGLKEGAAEAYKPDKMPITADEIKA